MFNLFFVWLIMLLQIMRKLYIQYYSRGFTSDCIILSISMRSIPDDTLCAMLKISCKHFFLIFCIIRLLRELKPKLFSVEIALSGIRTPHMGVEAFKPWPLSHGAFTKLRYSDMVHKYWFVDIWTIICPLKLVSERWYWPCNGCAYKQKAVYTSMFCLSKLTHSSRLPK